MATRQKLNVYQCPHIESCIFPVDETHFNTHCKEIAATPKHPQYEQCQGYTQMNDLPRNWFKRSYKQGQDIGMGRARHRV